MAPRARTLGLAALGVGAALFGHVGAARANGRPLRTVDIHVRPGNPDDILIAATIGMMISHDGGQTWRWMCEQAIGYGGTWDPDYLYSPTGRIFATTFDGLQILLEDECGFGLGATGNLNFSRVAQSSTGRILATAVAPDDSRLYRSDDDGDTFEPTLDLAETPGDWWQSLEFAPSDPDRVYLAGYHLALGEPKALKLFRSDDAGDSFTPLPIDDFDFDENSTLEIAAISPTDPDTLLARITYHDGTIGDAIYLSTDGGASFTKKLELDDEAPGVLIRPDGTMYVAERNRALPSYVSTDGGASFQLLPAEGATDVHCLRNAPDGGLYVCGHYTVPDELAVGHGATFGAWTEVFDFHQMAGPVRCAEGTAQRDVCEDNVWCGLKAMYGLESDEVACGAPRTDAAAAPDATTVGGDSGGPVCGCGASSPSGALALALGTLVPVLGRRRRRRA